MPGSGIDWVKYFKERDDPPSKKARLGEAERPANTSSASTDKPTTEEHLEEHPKEERLEEEPLEEQLLEEQPLEEEPLEEEPLEEEPLEEEPLEEEPSTPKHKHLKEAPTTPLHKPRKSKQEPLEGEAPATRKVEAAEPYFLENEFLHEEPDFEENPCLKWEPVNAALLDRTLQLSALRRASTGSNDYFELLYWFRQRVVGVRGKEGHIPVLLRASKGLGELKGRLYSGVGQLEDKDLPPPLKAELGRGVPRRFVGVSAFCLPRNLRNLLRHGLGLTDVDLSNAYFSLMSKELPHLVPEALQSYVANRGQQLKLLQDGLGIDRDEAKKLVLRLGFGGGFYTWLQEKNLILEDCLLKAPAACQLLESLETAAQVMMRGVAAAYKDELKTLKEKGKTRAKATLTFMVYSDLERPTS